MSCKFYEPQSEWRECTFFKWIGEDMTEWQRHLTDEIILKKKVLEAQLTTSQSEVKELESQRSWLLIENGNVNFKYKALNAEMKLHINLHAMYILCN
ncbi:putative 39S ribosomal protein L24 mitochondrial [Bienertia sinuspersici]